jgi:hypothetical protein
MSEQILLPASAARFVPPEENWVKTPGTAGRSQSIQRTILWFTYTLSYRCKDQSVDIRRSHQNRAISAHKSAHLTES